MGCGPWPGVSAARTAAGYPPRPGELMVAMASAIELLVGGPLALIGLSFIAYLRALRKRGPGYLVVMYGLVVLMLPLSLYVLVILGLLDRLFQFRARNPLP